MTPPATPQTSQTRPIPAAPPTPVPGAGWRAPALVALAAAGPLAVAVLRGVLPYDTEDDSLTVAAKVAADPAAQSAVLWCAYLALLTLPLGVLVVARVAVRARPVLGAVAAAVAWLGFASLPITAAVDQVPLAAPSVGLDPAGTAALIDAVSAHPAHSLGLLVFVAGHIVGTVLLGIAIWSVVPRWAAVALIVSQPLHLLFAVAVVNHQLDAVSWALTAVGFAAAARVRR
jgi:hypothetical protein